MGYIPFLFVHFTSVELELNNNYDTVVVNRDQDQSVSGPRRENVDLVNPAWKVG